MEWNYVSVQRALNIVEELFQERDYRSKLLNQINEESKKMNHSITELLEDY